MKQAFKTFGKLEILIYSDKTEQYNLLYEFSGRQSSDPCLLAL